MITPVIRLVIATLLLILAFILLLIQGPYAVIQSILSLILAIISVVLFMMISMQKVHYSEETSYISVTNITIANASLILQLIMVPPFIMLELYWIVVSGNISQIIFYVLIMIYLIYYQIKYFKKWREILSKRSGHSNDRLTKEG